MHLNKSIKYTKLWFKSLYRGKEMLKISLKNNPKYNLDIDDNWPKDKTLVVSNSINSDLGVKI